VSLGETLNDLFSSYLEVSTNKFLLAFARLLLTWKCNLSFSASFDKISVEVETN
jgi:hypothetical protein